MSEVTPREIVLIFYRGRVVFTLIFTCLFAVSVLFAARWSHYRAETTVQISPSQVPASLIAVGNADPADLALGLADRRISQIVQDVTANDSLQKIIESLNLYPQLRKTVPGEVVSATMRRHVDLNFISSAVANPVAAQKETIEQLSAIAFTLRFTYDDPVLAKQALDAILDRLIAQEAFTREKRNVETLAFLDQEISALESAIHTQETKIAKLKSQVGETGPSAVMFQQQASLTGAMTLQTLITQIASTEASIHALTAQLAATTPYLQAEDQPLTAPLSKQSVETQLAVLQSRYGAMHPDVVKLRQQLATLNPAQRRLATDANNPAYIQLSSQLAAANASLAALKNQRDVLAKQQEVYQWQMTQNPRAEQQMAELTLDLDHAKERYHALQDKRLSPAMKAKLDADNAKTRLQVIAPSQQPRHTTPPRKLIVLIGFFLSLLGASGMVLAREFLRHTVRSASHLHHLLGAPPLVTIPKLES